MATSTLPMTHSAVPDPSDAQLVDVAVLLLGTVSDPRLGAVPLSHVLWLACTSSACGRSCEARAEGLALGLAGYLHDRHVLLPSATATVAGLDTWAAYAPLDAVRAVVAGYALHLRGLAGRAPSWVTGPDVLTYAAALLPGIVAGDHPMCCDVHTACYETARLLQASSSAEAHRLADEAEAMLVGFLVGRGEAAVPLCDRRGEPLWSQSLRGWLLDRGVAAVVRALADAAVFYRMQLAAVTP